MWLHYIQNNKQTFYHPDECLPAQSVSEKHGEGLLYKVIMSEYLCFSLQSHFLQAKCCCFAWKYLQYAIAPSTSLILRMNFWWWHTDFSRSERTGGGNGVCTVSMSVQITGQISRKQRCVCVFDALPGCVIIAHGNMDFQLSVNGMALEHMQPQ